MARVHELVSVGTPADLVHPRLGRVLWRHVGNGLWCLVYAEPPTADPDDVLAADADAVLCDEWALTPGV